MTTKLLSRNAQAIVASYEAVNRRDIEGSIELVGDGYRFVDHAQRISGEGKGAVREWMESMLAGSSDLRCEAEVLVDLTDLVIVKVVSQGTHDGVFGEIPPTGRQVRTVQCELHRFDDDGRLVESEMFYDLYGMLADMGVVPSLNPDAQG